MTFRRKVQITATLLLLYSFAVGYLYLSLSDAPVDPVAARDVPAFQRLDAHSGVHTPDLVPEPSFAPTSTTIVPETTTTTAPVQPAHSYFRAPDTTISAPVKVSEGSLHRCWVEDAKPVCTGQEYHGELGKNVVLPPIVDVQAGDGRTCALDVHGDVWCWGWKLGYGDDYDKIADAYEPVKVRLPGKVTILEVGLGQECAAVKVDVGYEIWCWGFGYSQEHGFALPFYAAPDNPVIMWSGRHVHGLEGGHRWMRAHVSFEDGGCGWVHWGQYGGKTSDPIINRPERM